VWKLRSLSSLFGCATELIPHLDPFQAALARAYDGRKLLLRQFWAERIERAFEFERRETQPGVTRDFNLVYDAPKNARA